MPALDALLELREFVRRVLDLAQLLLDRLHLLVEVVLALALLHLLLDAAADALFDLQHVHLAFDQREDVLQALAHVLDLQDLLLGVELQRHVRGDVVGEPARLLDASERGQSSGGTLRFSFTYCSNCEVTERASTSISRSSYCSTSLNGATSAEKYWPV